MVSELERSMTFPGGHSSLRGQLSFEQELGLECLVQHHTVLASSEPACPLAVVFISVYYRKSSSRLCCVIQFPARVYVKEKLESV